MSPLATFFAKYWKKGLAVGRPDIVTDSIDFSYKDEKFRFPALAVMDICMQNGSFYTVKVKKLRALKAKLKANRHV